jgi:hypothetical protein
VAAARRARGDQELGEGELAGAVDGREQREFALRYLCTVVELMPLRLAAALTLV